MNVNIKPTLYIDLDGVVADYDKYMKDNLLDDNNHKGFFENLQLMEDSYNSVLKLSEKYDIYFLSTAPWSNIHAWSEKRIWIDKHFGDIAFKKLILSHNKGLLKGQYLIDDRILNGVAEFEGEHIHFGSDKFPNWSTILEYLL